jgi:formiminotetrahydrofolate cyclodeaminase
MGCCKGGGTMNWMDMTLRDFQAALASSSPTPGGGTAAAVALGQSAALTCMVTDLTIGKEKWQEGWQIAEDAQNAAIPLMGRAGELATEDSDSFDAVMACFKMPKGTTEEIETRRNCIRQSTLKAAEVPFETATLALSLLRHLPDLAAKGNGNAASDVGVAALLASAAVKGALYNVEINLSSIPEEMGAHMRKLTPDILEEARVLSRDSMKSVNSRLGL